MTGSSPASRAALAHRAAMLVPPREEPAARSERVDIRQQEQFRSAVQLREQEGLNHGTGNHTIDDRFCQQLFRNDPRLPQSAFVIGLFSSGTKTGSCRKVLAPPFE